MLSPGLAQERVDQLGEEVMTEVVDTEMNLMKESGFNEKKHTIKPRSLVSFVLLVAS